MKLKRSLIASFVIFSSLAFSACTDESENIIPQPVEVEDAAATTGTHGESHKEI